MIFGRKRPPEPPKRRMRFRVTLVNGDVREFETELTSFKEMVNGAFQGKGVFDGDDNTPGAIGINLAHVISIELLEVS